MLGMKVIKKRVYKDGYMTLEAALLFPVIFTIIIMLLYMGFFMYDRCLLESSAYIAALRGSRMQLMNNDEIYDKTYTLGEDLVKGRVFAASNVSMKVKVSFEEVEVTYDAKVVPPVGSLLIRSLYPNCFEIHVQKQAKRIRTIPIIRMFRRAERILNEKDRKSIDRKSKDGESKDGEREHNTKKEL